MSETHTATVAYPFLINRKKDIRTFTPDSIPVLSSPKTAHNDLHRNARCPLDREAMEIFYITIELALEV